MNNHQLGAALVDALGLPKHTSAITLSMKVGRPLEVRCEYYPEPITGPHFETLIAEFKQVKLERINADDDHASRINEQFEQLRRDIATKADQRGELALNEIHRMGEQHETNPDL